MPYLGKASAYQDESPRIGYREPAPEPKPEPEPFPWDFVAGLAFAVVLFGMFLWFIFTAIFVWAPAETEAKKTCETMCDPYLVAASSRDGACICDVTRAHGKRIGDLP